MLTITPVKVINFIRSNASESNNALQALIEDQFGYWYSVPQIEEIRKGFIKFSYKEKIKMLNDLRLNEYIVENSDKTAAQITKVFYEENKDYCPYSKKYLLTVISERKKELFDILPEDLQDLVLSYLQQGYSVERAVRELNRSKGVIATPDKIIRSVIRAEMRQGLEPCFGGNFS